MEKRATPLRRGTKGLTHAQEKESAKEIESIIPMQVVGACI